MELNKICEVIASEQNNNHVELTSHSEPTRIIFSVNSKCEQPLSKQQQRGLPSYPPLSPPISQCPLTKAQGSFNEKVDSK